MQLTHLQITKDAITLQIPYHNSMLSFVYVMMALKLLTPLVFMGIEVYRGNSKANGFFSAGVMIAATLTTYLSIKKGVKANVQKQKRELAEPAHRGPGSGTGGVRSAA